MKKQMNLLFTGCVLLLSCTDPSNQVNLVNDKAALPAAFNFDRLGLKVMASSINKKHNTMSTLYANVLALQSAVKGLKDPLPGEAFALITWRRQADDHWFGANIPGELQSIELVNTTKAITSYKKYEGRSLTLNSDTLDQSKRIKYILSLHPSIMP
jgi:hypothetical protein